MGVTLRIERKKTGILDKIVKSVLNRGPKRVAVGFPTSKSTQSNIEKAIYNEFGTRGGASGGGWGGPIPERPFMRNAIRNNQSRYQQILKSSAAGILTARVDRINVLNKIGALAQGDIQDEITTLSSPANSPVTIKLKGSSNPLIDTGAMRAAVTWELE